MDTGHVIRPSMLPSYQDCPRRAVAVAWPSMVRAAGFELRVLAKSVGAHVGSGVHAGAAYSLRAKLESGGGNIGSEGDAVEHAVAEYRRRCEDDGVAFDEVTTNTSVAEKQLQRMTRTYRRQLVPEIDPVAVEERLEAEIGDGWAVSGQADNITREPDRLRDLKTGRVQRANGSQYGAYSLLERSHGRPLAQACEDYLPRVPLSKDQPPATVTPIALDAAEHEARETIEALRRDVEEFERRLYGGGRPPEMAFRSNPSSVLCSEKWCPAWGTTFCRAHKGAR